MKYFFVYFVAFMLIVNITTGKDNSSRFLRKSGCYQYTSYQEGIICNAAQHPFKPRNLEEIRAVVKMALQNNYTVKAIGNLHSATDIICTDGIPVSIQNINHFIYNKHTELATVGAGSTLETFLENLHALGRTIHGIPTYGGITIGGAIGTGAHGTSFKSPASLSDLLVGIVVVDGLGNTRNITDLETLRTFRTNLGLLGIVYEVTFPTIPQYKIQAKYFPKPDRILWKQNVIKELLHSNDHFKFLWFPTLKHVVLYEANHVPVTIPGNCQTNFLPGIPQMTAETVSEAVETMQAGMDHFGYFMLQYLAKIALYQIVPGRTPMFTQFNSSIQICKPAVGYVHRMVANTCKVCAWGHGKLSVYNFESAVIVPLSELDRALQTMRKIMQEYPVDFPLTGIIIRFLPASDGLMSLNGGRDSVSIEWILVPRKDRFNKPMMGLPTCQAMVQALITKHSGRAHWGKNGLVYTQQKFLQKAYPYLGSFIKYMDKFDPFEVFLNDFGRKLKFGSTSSSIDPYVTHCALVDNCICQNDNDCGNQKPGSYFCGYLQNYRVCRERTGEYKTFRSNVARNFLQKYFSPNGLFDYLQ